MRKGKNSMKKESIIYKILEKKSTAELIQIANELNMMFIPCDGLCRKVAAEIFNVSIEETNLVQLIGLAPALSLELAKRLKYEIDNQLRPATGN